MNIHHDPLFDIDKITEHYSKKDGNPCIYVCTSDLVASDVPVDIYYMAERHPDFGNHYFGLYYDVVRDHAMITNADIVETLEFGMVEHNGEWFYSQSHHDFRTIGKVDFIDGGRVYCRTSMPTKFFEVKDGKFFEKK